MGLYPAPEPVQRVHELLQTYGCQTRSWQLCSSSEMAHQREHILLRAGEPTSAVALEGSECCRRPAVSATRRSCKLPSGLISHSLVLQFVLMQSKLSFGRSICADWDRFGERVDMDSREVGSMGDQTEVDMASRVTQVTGLRPTCPSVVRAIQRPTSVDPALSDFCPPRRHQKALRR